MSAPLQLRHCTPLEGGHAMSDADIRVQLPQVPGWAEAGGSLEKRYEFADYPSDEFMRTLAVHVLGAFHILKHGAPHVPDGGSIVITSSVTGLIGPPAFSAYVAAKHGQVGLMRTAAKELAARRIRVNTLHPGPTATPFQDDIEMRATGESQEQAARIFDGMIPLGRHTTPEEVAHAVLYLAADESAMVTSHTLSIDGGMSG